MGVVGDGTVVAPFANEAMRLLREDWKGKYGSKMLAEELFPILQTGIPNPDQNFQNFITINAGDTGAFAQLIDKFGNKIFEITAAEGLKPIEPPGYPPPKLKPRIVWGPHTIVTGDSISGTELDAVAVDPETGATIAGVSVYTPASGTVFPAPGTATLYVKFTPTDGVKYRRSMGSTVLTVVGAKIPDINWSNPASILIGTPLSGTQLNATATDPVTFAPVAGIFTYTPPSGTVLSAGSGQNLHVDFVPTDTVTYTDASGDVSINVGAAAIVQQTGVSGSTGAGVVAFASPVVAGDMLVVAVSVYGLDSGVTIAVTDSQGNSYTQVGSDVRQTQGSREVSVSMWKCVASTSGACTVTATPSAGNADAVQIAEFSVASMVDSTSSNSGSSGSFTTGTIGVTGLSDVVVAVFGTASAVGQIGGVGSGFTVLQYTVAGAVTPHETLGEYKVGVSSGIAATATGTASVAWVALGASFK